MRFWANWTRCWPRVYAEGGRPSIPPERLLRASLLQVVYSVRSERLLMEQLNYNLLFRWFVGLNIDDPVWDHSTFSFNRDRLFDAEIAQSFFEHTVLLARLSELVSDEHFSVDGTLLEAWPRTRASVRRVTTGMAMAVISAARNEAMKHMPPRPIRMPGWRAKAKARRPPGVSGQRPDGKPPWAAGGYRCTPCPWHG